MRGIFFSPRRQSGASTRRRVVEVLLFCIFSLVFKQHLYCCLLTVSKTLEQKAQAFLYPIFHLFFWHLCYEIARIIPLATAFSAEILSKTNAVPFKPHLLAAPELIISVQRLVFYPLKKVFRLLNRHRTAAAIISKLRCPYFQHASILAAKLVICQRIQVSPWLHKKAKII